LSKIQSERAQEFLEKLNQLCQEFCDGAKEHEDFGASLVMAGRLDGHPFVMAAGEAFGIAAAAQLAAFAAHDALNHGTGPHRFGDDEDEPPKKGGWGKLL
jgi:hypothetical protein